MRKLFLAIGLGLGLHANADTYVIDTDACAGTEYIYDENNEIVEYDATIHSFITEETPVYYAETQTTPLLRLGGSYSANLIVANTSSNSVNFFIKPTYYSEGSASEATTSTGSLFGIFSTSNTPFSSGGASLPSKGYGRVQFSLTDKNSFSLQLNWDSSTCMESAPLKSSIDIVYANSTSKFYGMSYYLVNNGLNW